MSRYKFKIEKDSGKYIFAMYPNNSNSQPIGISGEKFATYRQCEEGILKFKKIVRETSDMEEFYSDDPISLKHDGKIIFIRTVELGKYQHKAWLQRIKNNIDANIK